MSETGIDGLRNQQTVWSGQDLHMEKRLLSAVFSKLCFLPLGHLYDQGFLLWKFTKLAPDVLQHLCKHHHLLMTCHFLVPSGSLQFWCFKSDISSKRQNARAGFAAERETSSPLFVFCCKCRMNQWKYNIKVNKFSDRNHDPHRILSQ